MRDLDAHGGDLKLPAGRCGARAVSSASTRRANSSEGARAPETTRGVGGPHRQRLEKGVTSFLGGAALARGETRAPWPAPASLGLRLSLLTLFTTFANPLTEAGELMGDLGTALGVAGVLVQAALLAGVVLFVARR
ncbi:MAG: hypothetical protein AB1511_10790 [Deinococcota bacterium]